MLNQSITILRIEHPVPHYEGWKKAFDTDPINRKKSGVTRYRIYRLVENPNYVVVDLEFSNLQDAENTLTSLRKLWEKVEGSVMTGPQARILAIVETVEL